jgi:hypothetical protein
MSRLRKADAERKKPAPQRDSHRLVNHRSTNLLTHSSLPFPDSTARTFPQPQRARPPVLLLLSYHTTRFKPHRREASELPRGGEERPPPKAVSASHCASQSKQATPKALAQSRPGDHATPRHAQKQQRARQRRPDRTRGRGGHQA